MAEAFPVGKASAILAHSVVLVELIKQAGFCIFEI